MHRSPTTVAVLLVLAVLLAPTGARAAPIEDFVAALARADAGAMREVVRGNREELALDFFLLVKEASSLLSRSEVAEERQKARAFLFAAGQLAVTFNEAYPGQDVLSRRVAGSTMLTPMARTAATSDLALAAYLTVAANELADPSFAAVPKLQEDLISLFLAAVAPPVPGPPPPLEEQQRQQSPAEEAKPPEREVTAARAHPFDPAAVARVVLGLRAVLWPALLILILLLVWRRWIWPGAKVEVSPGGRTRLAGALRKGGRSAEPGKILYTAWGRNAFGRRRRIKLEVLASLGGSANAFDVVVAAGASVRPGTYLATAPAGSVKVRVRQPR